VASARQQVKELNDALWERVDAAPDSGKISPEELQRLIADGTIGVAGITQLLNGVLLLGMVVQIDYENVDDIPERTRFALSRLMHQAKDIVAEIGVASGKITESELRKLRAL
jgi:hypothetical protein